MNIREKYSCFFIIRRMLNVSYLMTEEQLMFSDEIDCMDLFEGENPREKILVFEII